jgi:antitoxin CptB
MAEDRETRLRRLRLRSWRRGTKEMDLVLGAYADEEMRNLSEADLNAHEVIMAENDHDLYQWISGQSEVPSEIAPAISRVTKHFMNKYQK